MADAHALAWEALAALPKPVTRDAAIEAVRPILTPMGLMDSFTHWFDKLGNGDVLLKELNG